MKIPNILTCFPNIECFPLFASLSKSQISKVDRREGPRFDFIRSFEIFPVHVPR